MAIPPPHLFWGPGNFLFLLHVTNLLSFFFFFCTQKFLDPRLNLHHSSDNAGSLTHGGTGNSTNPLFLSDVY